MKRYEVYENNAGGLALLVYDDAGRVNYIHTGYEFVPGQLQQDLAAIAQGDDPSTEWDGNEIDDFDESDVYGEWGELVADNSGTYLGCAGYAANAELGGIQ